MYANTKREIFVHILDIHVYMYMYMYITLIMYTHNYA